MLWTLRSMNKVFENFVVVSLGETLNLSPMVFPKKRPGKGRQAGPCWPDPPYARYLMAGWNPMHIRGRREMQAGLRHGCVVVFVN